MNTPEALIGIGIAAWIILVLSSMLFFLVVNSLFLMIGAKIAGIEHRTFAKALLATIMIIFLAGIPIGLLSLLHWVIGLLGMILVPALFIKLAYSCPLGRAVVAYILSIIASFLITACLVFALFSGLVAVGLLQKGDSVEEVPPAQTEQVESATEETGTP